MKKQTLHTIATGLLITLSTLSAKAQVSIPSLKANEKYTVLTVTPDTQGMTMQQKQLIEKVKVESKNLTEKISTVAGQAFSQEKGISQIFVNLGESLKADLGPQLDTLRSSLPADDAMYLSVYVLPWETTVQTQTEVQNSILSMIGPVQEARVDLTQLALAGKSKTAEFYGKINSQIRSLKLAETDKFQLQSIAFHIKLVRGDSQIRIQLLGRLKQMSTPFVKDNEQVHIKAIEIFGNEATQQRPMLLMDITQHLQDKSRSLPEIVMDFGQFGGVSGGYRGWPGAYQILSNPWAQNDCKNKLNSTPALTGTLANGAVGNNMIAKALGKLIGGTAIKFRILNFQIDASTLKISKMNLAIEVGHRNFPQCLSAESINSKFQDQANAAIEEQLNSLYKQDDMTDDLMGALYN
jgi:hypothetical protein